MKSLYVLRTARRGHRRGLGRRWPLGVRGARPVLSGQGRPPARAGRPRGRSRTPCSRRTATAGSNLLNVLAQTTPARSWSAMERMREPFSVQTPADSPYGVLLAFSTASAGVRNVSTDSTGPKISSRAMRCAWETPVKSVGANQNPRSGSSHGGDQRSAPSASPGVGQLPDAASCAAELIAPMSVFLSSGSPTRSCAIRRFSESSSVVGDRLLHQQPGAGAAHVALVEEDAVDDALDRLVDRGVVEDDVRGLAAQLQGDLLAVPATDLRDGAADLGGAGEGDLVDVGVLDQQRDRSRRRR